jgi:hypothetical protein
MIEKHLISRDAKDKIRVVEISYKWNEELHAYIIYRKTYQFGGKITNQPAILINKGKANRTVTEQALLEFNSNLKKYVDKGYKELPLFISNYTLSELNELLPNNITDANGIMKPMLAKDYNKVSYSIYDKNKWFASRKIDGIRCIMYYKNNEIHTASRGGGDYDPSMLYFRNNTKLQTIFKENPDIILDGEIYVHGWPLQKISGIARLEKSYEDCDKLEYWIYDLVQPTVIFSDRLDRINELTKKYNLCTDINYIFNDEDLRIKIVPHVEVEGWLAIDKLHIKYVNEGFEGVVIRNPNKCYGVNKRTNDMIKIKNYREDTFKVVGIEQGLRKYDDMTFVCETKNHKEFRAKPFGNHDIKVDYTDNFTEKYLNKYGDVKFFYYSNDDNEETGVPLQPSFKCFRYDNLNDNEI